MTVGTKMRHAPKPLSKMPKPLMQRLRHCAVKLDWRQTFLDAQSQDIARVAILEDQLNALAPVPETGVDPLADRRTALSEQLNAARAPLLRAEEAYSRASGLIREIDQIISARRTNALLELGPTPLAPSNG